eukprot:s841_g11.t1
MRENRWGSGSDYSAPNRQPANGWAVQAEMFITNQDIVDSAPDLLVGLRPPNWEINWTHSTTATPSNFPI